MQKLWFRSDDVSKDAFEKRLKTILLFGAVFWVLDMMVAVPGHAQNLPLPTARPCDDLLANSAHQTVRPATPQSRLNKQEVLSAYLLGAEFLYRRNQNLAKDPAVLRASQRLSVNLNKALTQPQEHIAAWLREWDLTLKQKENSSASQENQAAGKRVQLWKQRLYQTHLIAADRIPESYYELQAEILRQQGHGEVSFDQATRAQMAEVLVKDQKHSLDVWLDYLLNDMSDTPVWLRYWTLMGVLSLGKYDVESGEFASRSKSLVAPFAELNREALALTLNAVKQKVESKTITDTNAPTLAQGNLNFGKLYAYFLKQSNKTADEIKTLHEITEGKWVKYAKGSDPKNLVDSLQGQNTGWCTAGCEKAKTQLAGGDFYVYYSLDKLRVPTVPRLAIRMKGVGIAEVRGVAKDQNLDAGIAKTQILPDKLKEFGAESERYLKASADMQFLTEIEKKLKTEEELSRHELRFLYEIDRPILGFGYQKDPRIEKILQGRNQKEDVYKIFDGIYRPDQIAFSKTEFLNGKDIKVFIGDLSLSEFESIKGLSLPQIVTGDLYLSGLTSAVGLVLPQSIGGSLFLSGLTSAVGLVLPRFIGKSLDLNGLTSAVGLVLPQSIAGGLYLSGLKSAVGLVLPQSIGGDLFLRGLTNAVGLVLPQSIGESLNLSGLTSAVGLVLPRFIGKSLDLSGLTSAVGLVLPQSIGRDLYLSGLKSAVGLVLPQSIGRDLYLKSLTSTEGLILPLHLGGQYYGPALE